MHSKSNDRQNRGENMKAELGDEAKCKVTGFRGIITSTAQCLTGCDRVSIQAPMKKDGTYGENYWVDVAAVEIIKKAKVKPKEVREDGPKAKAGGPATRNTMR